MVFQDAAVFIQRLADVPRVLVKNGVERNDIEDTFHAMRGVTKGETQA